jgi:putative ABC transport system ATP-binding protein
MAGAAVRTVGVEKAYRSPPVRALRGVSLAVSAGERVALLGRSGSGKSTLLHLLGGLDTPTAGGVVVDGRDLAAMRSDERADYRRTTVGMVFQAFHLVPAQTARQNVELPLVFAGRPKRERRALAERALAAVGLAERAAHRPVELSGGERQRVALARALVNGPRLLLADEPTGNLDAATADEVMRYLLAFVADNGTTLVLVTHDEELAQRVTDRIIRLHDGQVVGG